MPLFKMKADMEFYADDIIDAFKKLADHFPTLMDEDGDSKLLSGGCIDIQKIDPKKEI